MVQFSRSASSPPPAFERRPELVSYTASEIRALLPKSVTCTASAFRALFAIFGVVWGPKRLARLVRIHRTPKLMHLMFFGSNAGVVNCVPLVLRTRGISTA